jgi:hypothetical protein
MHVAGLKPGSTPHDIPGLFRAVVDGTSLIGLSYQFLHSEMLICSIFLSLVVFGGPPMVSRTSKI